MLCSCALGPPYHARLGSQAPRFAAETLNQEWSRVAKVDLEDAVAEHEAVLISFGASYCGPCMLEWPILRDLAAEYQRYGLLVIFVVTDKEQEGIETMRVLSNERFGISSPVVVDRTGELAERYRVEELPQLYLIDDGGEIVWREIGYKGSTVKELSERLDGLLIE
jgi:alkyl hydroperoxide reductase subunit AhpC